jgi:hypothetical protein
MRKRKSQPGYIEAIEELEVAIIYGGRETRMLMRTLRELKRQLPHCNYPGGASNIDNYLIKYLRKDMALSLQCLTKHVNMARKVVMSFLDSNRLE